MLYLFSLLAFDTAIRMLEIFSHWAFVFSACLCGFLLLGLNFLAQFSCLYLQFSFWLTSKRIFLGYRHLFTKRIINSFTSVASLTCLYYPLLFGDQMDMNIASFLCTGFLFFSFSFLIPFIDYCLSNYGILFTSGSMFYVYYFMFQ